MHGASAFSSGLGINGSEPFPGSQQVGLSRANHLVILSQKKSQHFQHSPFLNADNFPFAVAGKDSRHAVTHRVEERPIIMGKRSYLLKLFSRTSPGGLERWQKAALYESGFVVKSSHRCPAEDSEARASRSHPTPSSRPSD